MCSDGCGSVPAHSDVFRLRFYDPIFWHTILTESIFDGFYSETTGVLSTIFATRSNDDDAGDDDANLGRW